MVRFREKDETIIVSGGTQAKNEITHSSELKKYKKIKIGEKKSREVRGEEPVKRHRAEAPQVQWPVRKNCQCEVKKLREKVT